jgi:hypothetical protein
MKLTKKMLRSVFLPNQDKYKDWFAVLDKNRDKVIYSDPIKPKRKKKTQLWTSKTSNKI